MSAMVFPGMSPAGFAEVGRFMLADPIARELIAEADEFLGYSLADRFRDTEGDYSEYAQLSFFVNCLALARWAERELGVLPRWCAGPSFGEIPAVVYAGALSFTDGLKLTERRARCLDAYFAGEHTDVVTRSFARTPEPGLREALGELTARGQWCEISCYVDDDMFMVSLREKNVEWLDGRIRSLGGLPLYTMRPPLHASVFAGLRDRAEKEVLAGLDFRDPVLPVVADQDGAVLTTAGELRTMLLDSYVRPLRWPAVVATLRDRGVGTVCVAGVDSLFGRIGVTKANFEVIAANPRRALRPRRRGAPVP
ncbi:ACP S-malonyltransferase [Amycolatopsis sp. NPDC059021]|uniref:ACP S-malonyltransferase n=1 Tax=Amycolatopsis sp. NPDC059021 TaxID=3346704 RepID=UPI0036725635